MSEPEGLGAVAWEPCALVRQPNRDVTRYVRKHMGLVPDYLDFLAPCSWVARQVIYWDSTSLPVLSLSPDVVELIQLVVAQDNSCRYCYAATTVFLRALGFDDERIQALDRDLTTAALTPATRAALELARRFSRADPLPHHEALAPLAAHFDRNGMLEIAYVAAVMGVNANRVVTIPALPVDGVEALSRRRWLRFFKPVYAFLTRRARRNARPMPLPPSMQAGPFQQVVRVFDGHPLGPRLWAQIDEAWASDILPRRTKALIAGVVGRALGCTRSESEARRLLALEGVTFDLDPVLANLASPELTDAETVIVPFVRETVHYSPAQIQRSGRAVLERLGQAAFIEVIGTAALVNALCRLAALLVDEPA